MSDIEQAAKCDRCGGCGYCDGCGSDLTLQDRLRALVKEWRERADREADRMEEIGSAHAVGAALLAGQNIGRVHCAIDLEELLGGAK